MAKTKDKVFDRAGGARPYIERAMKDEELRQNVRNAFESARSVYNELLGGRGAIPVAARSTVFVRAGPTPGPGSSLFDGLCWAGG